MAEIVLTAAEETVAESLDRETALKYIEDKSERKRAMGFSALGRLGESVRDIILQRLQDEVAKRKKRRRVVAWAAGVYGLAMGGALLVWLGAGIAMGHWGKFPWQLFQFFNFFGIFAGASAFSQFQKDVMSLVADFDDIRYVPYLIDCLGSDDKALHGLAAPALTNLLPKLAASDSHLVEAEDRQILHRALVTDNNTLILRRAILKGFEQIGDERDLGAIKRIAEGEAATDREKTLRAAARECLPYVEQRIELNRAANTLLRASTSDTAAADSLLRPVTTVREVESRDLLRPVDTTQGIPIAHESESVEPPSVQLQSHT